MFPSEITDNNRSGHVFSSSKKRRIRRKRLQSARSPENHYIGTEIEPDEQSTLDVETHVPKELNSLFRSKLIDIYTASEENSCSKSKISQIATKMSSNEDKKTRDDVLAAREAKKLAKLKAKTKGKTPVDVKIEAISISYVSVEKSAVESNTTAKETTKGKDEVDKAAVKVDELKTSVKTKDEIKASQAANKTAKQAKKKGETGEPANPEMTVKDVVETLKNIANVAKEVENVTAKVQAISLDGSKKAEESTKSKAELKAERRAKQEAQRAAKQVAVQQKAPVTSKTESKTTSDKPKDEKVPKAKTVDKSKPKGHSVHRVNWFQHLHMQHDKESLKNIAINSNLHPAIVKLGVQLASRVVAGSNARCIALLDALKQMVKDYTLPAKTEFARGLESHLASSLEYLWSMRQPSASQTNAVKFFRHHLTQLPNNVDEFDAKKTLQEEIDRYIREQIDMAGKAISLAVRNKISTGDNILTYGCSSLIERILCEAWDAGVQFRAVVVGNRVESGARDALRRLVARSVPCTYIDITALSFVMKTINKVLLGASALLVNGSVLGAVGTAQVALVAKSYNVPVLVACETHKFSERVQTDAFVYNEIGDPDELIDNTDSNSPLKDWRSNPNLTPLNLTYDVTPPSLVTAVVTELAILPCTSAPVVLRFKLSEYGI